MHTPCDFEVEKLETFDIQQLGYTFLNESVQILLFQQGCEAHMAWGSMAFKAKTACHSA